MKEGDVYGYRTRSKAVYSIIAEDYVKTQLLTGSRRETDILTLIEMHDDSEVVFSHEPMDYELYNMLLHRRDDAGK